MIKYMTMIVHKRLYMLIFPITYVHYEKNFPRKNRLLAYVVQVNLLIPNNIPIYVRGFTPSAGKKVNDFREFFLGW